MPATADRAITIFQPFMQSQDRAEAVAEAAA